MVEGGDGAASEGCVVGGNAGVSLGSGRYADPRRLSQMEPPCSTAHAAVFHSSAGAACPLGDPPAVGQQEWSQGDPEWP